MDLLLWNLLISSSSNGINFTHLSEFTTTIHDVYNFENLVVISSENFADKSVLHAFVKIVQSNLRVSIVSVSQHSEHRLWHILNQNSLAINFMDTMNDTFLLYTMDRVLRGRHSTKIVIVLGEKLPRPEDSKVIFELCRELHFVNVVLLFRDVVGSIQKFSYYLFPEISIRNLTSHGGKYIFEDKVRNVQGYTFKSPVVQDPPRVIKLKRNGKNIITGTAANTLLKFIQSINGTFRAIIVPNFTQANIAILKKMIRTKEVEIAIHPHGMYNFSDFSATYPSQIVHWCLIVPVFAEIAPYMYLLLPFDSSVWYSLLAAIVYLSAVEYFAMKSVMKSSDFGYLWCKVIRQVLYISGYKMSHICIDVQILFLGFIISNIYSAFLTTFLTSSVDGPQINSAEDFVRKNLPMMLIDYEHDSILEAYKDSFPCAFFRLFQRADIETFMLHRNNLNRSYAYTATSERWKLLFDQQHYLKRHTFRASNVCFGSYFLSYGISRDSPFLDALNNFLVLVQQTGLNLKWEDNTFQEALQAGILHHRTYEDEYICPLNLAHFTLVWYVLVFGLLSAFGCFLVEKIVFCFKNK